MRFNELSYNQQLHHLDTLARQALAAYGQGGAATLVSYTNNAIYHVAGGYTLRIHRPGLKPLLGIEAELAWLHVLHHNGLCVPAPAGTVYNGHLEGVEQPVYCSLLHWINGNSVAEPSSAQIQAVGRALAQLHRIPAPAGLERPRLDAEGLFGSDSPYASPQEAQFFTAGQREVIERVTACLRTYMQGETRLIHGDPVLKNVLFKEGQVCLIDFDDCAYGYPLYDLASFLWWLPEARADLLAGYGAVDEAALDAFIMARQIASCRWIAGNAEHPALRGKARAIIAQRVQQLEQAETLC